MVESALLNPVSEEDPCGPDMRWDPAFIELDQAMQALCAEDTDMIADATAVQSDTGTFDDITESAERLLMRTKDLRIFAVYAEAMWRGHGLGDFANAMQIVAAALETWSDFNEGIHPRADPEDGDLGERVAAITKILKFVPQLSLAVEWGVRPEITERIEIATKLREVFENWADRLAPAFGPELPSCRAAWGDLSNIVGTEVEMGDDDSQPGGGGGGGHGGDGWDLIERAAEVMGVQDRHSPALPVLRMLAAWRTMGLVDIADAMKPSGVSLEQLLDSIKRQRDGSGQM